jgi:hypothetical protein
MKRTCCPILIGSAILLQAASSLKRNIDILPYCGSNTTQPHKSVETKLYSAQRDVFHYWVRCHEFPVHDAVDM